MNKKIQTAETPVKSILLADWILFMKIIFRLNGYNDLWFYPSAVCKSTGHYPQRKKKMLIKKTGNIFLLAEINFNIVQGILVPGTY